MGVNHTCVQQSTKLPNQQQTFTHSSLKCYGDNNYNQLKVPSQLSIQQPNSSSKNNQPQSSQRIISDVDIVAGWQNTCAIISYSSQSTYNDVKLICWGQDNGINHIPSNKVDGINQFNWVSIRVEDNLSIGMSSVCSIVDIEERVQKYLNQKGNYKNMENGVLNEVYQEIDEQFEDQDINKLSSIDANEINQEQINEIGLNDNPNDQNSVTSLSDEILNQSSSQFSPNQSSLTPPKPKPNTSQTPSQSSPHSSIICWGLCNDNICSIPTSLNLKPTPTPLSPSFPSKHPTLTPRKVSLGRDHACAIAPSLHLYCWGSNTYGQADPPSDFNHYTWDVATGQSISCAVRLDYYMHCWGYVMYRPEQIPQVIRNQAAGVTAGYNHACRIRGGKVGCVGDNRQGQLDLPQGIREADSNSEGGFVINSIKAGQNQNCILSSSNITNPLKFLNTPDTNTHQYLTTHSISNSNSSSLSCWGYNMNGQTDVNPLYQHNNIKVQTGVNHTCAIQHIQFDINSQSIRRLNCWGSDMHRQVTIPLEMQSITVDVQIASVGQEHTCASGKPSWNQNQRVDYDEGEEQEDLGSLHVQGWFNRESGLRGEGQYIKCWGSNKYGQVELPDQYRDRLWMAEHDIMQVESGDFHVCIVNRRRNQQYSHDQGDEYNKFNNQTECYGNNLQGQIVVPHSVKNRVITNISSGSNFNCAMQVELDLILKIECWGESVESQKRIPDKINGMVMKMSKRGDIDLSQNDKSNMINKYIEMSLRFDNACWIISGVIDCQGKLNNVMKNFNDLQKIN